MMLPRNGRLSGRRLSKCTLWATSLLVGLPSFVFAKSSGITGQARDGCFPCHGAAPIDYAEVCIDGLPTNGQYTPGQAYLLTVTVGGLRLPPKGEHVAGFNLEVTGGTLLEGGADRDVFRSDTEATHTTRSNKRNSWVLTWTAPQSGDATLYLAGNSVNGDGLPTGDLWNKMSVSLISGTGMVGSTCTNPPAIPLPEIPGL